MTGTPNYAQKIIDDAIDRDTQAFLNSKEIRTKALSEQRMDLIMRRGELLQLAQNRVNQVMQSATFELAREEAKANIKAIYEKLEQSKQENLQNYQLVMAGIIKDLIVSDQTMRTSLGKEQRKRYVNSITLKDPEGETFIIPGYLARDAKSAEELTNDQQRAQDIFNILDDLDELHKDPTKFGPGIFSKTAKEIDTQSYNLELLLKNEMKMGANYSEYEQTLIQGIMPTAKWHEKFSIYKTKSAKLRKDVVNRLRSAAKVRGASVDTPMPTTKNNIENFGGTKGVSN